MKKAVCFAMVFGILMLVPGLVDLVSANSADITQVGDRNIATTDQTGTGNTSVTNQYGRNFADVDQTGDNNTAIVNQGADGAPVNNYYQPATPSDWKQGAYVEQNGDDNIATMTMTGSGIGARIFQDGDSNAATQSLGANSSYTNANKPYLAIEINQVGDFNQAIQSTTASFGSYGIQNMLISQQGNLNKGLQESIGGMASQMNINQVGNSNDSTQYQNGRFSRTTANVVGSGNVTDQYQLYAVWSTSGANLADILIIGDINDVSQRQIGESNVLSADITGNANVINQLQTGNINIAAVTQNGNGNSAIQSQIGNGNEATIIQSGNSNVATQEQSGNSNVARITQIGDSNIASQVQLGSGFSSVVAQAGNFNVATVTQK